jgi:hypothetical protein
MRRSALIVILLSACAPHADVASGKFQAPSGNAQHNDDESFGSTQVQDAPATPSMPPAPANPSGDPQLPPSIMNREVPPSYSACSDGDSPPITSQDDAKANGGVGLTGKVEQPWEVKGGLDKSFL